MTLAWLAATLLPFVVAIAVAAALRRSRWAGALADAPNERSMHSVPRPRVGGIGLLTGALPVAAAAGTSALAILIACAAALALVSLADDVRDLPIEVRLPAHAIAALVAVLAIGAPGAAGDGLGIVAALIAIVALMWMANLFNFMDGADGLAGGMAAIGFGALAAGAMRAGDAPLALASAAIAAASAGFLALNFPPARVFMGDAGSVPIGFLAGAFGLCGALTDVWPLWFPLLVFSPFIVDASVTLARRVLRGDRFWRAHREHAYQRLLLAGWTPRRLLVAAYALMGASAASALVALAAGGQARLGIIVVWAALYALILFAVERYVDANRGSRGTTARPVR